MREADSLFTEGDWVGAAILYDELTRMNPVKSRYWHRLGECRRQLGDYSGSNLAYERSLALGFEGGDAFLSYEIGRNYARLDQPTQAVSWLRRALRLRKQFLQERAVEDDPALDGIRDHPGYGDLVTPTLPPEVERVEGWRFDLAYMARHLEQGHRDVFRHVTADDWALAVRRTHDAIPMLTDDQVKIEFLRLIALLGDGHTGLYCRWERMLPIRLYSFSDGVFVRSASPEHADLAGARLLRVGPASIEEALELVRPLTSRDNEMGMTAWGPGLLTKPELLAALGLSDAPDRASLRLRFVDGSERTVEVGSLPYDWSTSAGTTKPRHWAGMNDGAPTPEPLYLKHARDPFWFTYLEDHDLVYAAFNAVVDPPGSNLAKKTEELLALVDAKDARALVIDLRMNGGGNLIKNRAFYHSLIRHDRINDSKRLFVLIGRRTFSAAAHLVANLEKHTNATFVGEPIAAPPNFTGETNRFPLPYSGMIAGASNYHWQGGWDWDTRTWVAPDVYVPLSSDQFRQNADPVLERVIAALP